MSEKGVDMSGESHRAVTGAVVSPGKGNRLGREKSPYLLQHKDNPVWWYPWGDEAFAAARKEDKPIFLSVGYSTCHWCHVMEHECFENPDVAQALNRDFISIKVDREERPDVDDIYMTAVQAMAGRGGWPMSVWLTPDGRPFFGGTYFPRAQFLELLGAIAKTWKEDRGRVEETGRRLASALASHELAERGGSLSEDTLAGFFRSFRAGFDAARGGERGAPKFPPGYAMRLLLRIHRRTENGEAVGMVKTTLECMARGGIYDHVGGGFHRYSTDDRWLVPHFEKMLYDQASLASAYTEAWLATKEKEFSLVARETLDYVLRDMTHPEGGFYSAEDADSEGVEGKFYLWTDDELKRLLAHDEYASVAAAYGVTARGNYEHSATILNLQPGQSRSNRPEVLDLAMKKLLAARARRVRPHLDDKVLTSWNGLMISAMARAYQAFGEPRYLQAAQKAAHFVLNRLRAPDGRLLRRWREGEARFPGYVDDYAFFIDGLIELYQSDFDRKWIDEAARLQQIQDGIYQDKERGGYFFTDGSDKSLLKRGREFFDDVRPNSVSALNLLRLSDLLGEPSLRTEASRIFAAAAGTVSSSPSAFPQLLMALDYSLERSKEIAIVGERGNPETLALVAALRGGYNPNKVIALGTGATAEEPIPLLRNKPLVRGRPTAYVCEKGTCKLPTNDPEQARLLAAEMKPYKLES